MKRMVIQAQVEDEKLDEMIEKVRKLFGKEVDIGVSDAAPKGAGATLAGVA